MNTLGRAEFTTIKGLLGNIRRRKIPVDTTALTKHITKLQRQNEDAARDIMGTMSKSMMSTLGTRFDNLKEYFEGHCTADEANRTKVQENLNEFIQRVKTLQKKKDHIISLLEAQVKLKLQNEKKIRMLKAQLETLSREKNGKVSKAEKDIIAEQYKSIFKPMTTLSNHATLMQQEMTKLGELRNTIASLQDEKKEKETKLSSAESQLLAKVSEYQELLTKFQAVSEEHDCLKQH
eukprot:m51a1_g9867 hypothetical protein (235) ;mRNA; f:68558-70962